MREEGRILEEGTRGQRERVGDGVGDMLRGWKRG